jgi:hypothetical protein
VDIAIILANNRNNLPILCPNRLIKAQRRPYSDLFLKLNKGGPTSAVGGLGSHD